MASKNAHIIENPRSIIVTKVGVADGFLHIKNLEYVAFFLSESEVHRLLTLEQNFDRKPKEQIVDETVMETKKKLDEFMANFDDQYRFERKLTISCQRAK